MVEHLELTSPEKQKPHKWNRNRNERPGEFIGIGLHLVEQQLRVLFRCLDCLVQSSGSRKIKVGKAPAIKIAFAITYGDQSVVYNL